MIGSRGCKYKTTKLITDSVSVLHPLISKLGALVWVIVKDTAGYLKSTSLLMHSNRLITDMTA